MTKKEFRVKNEHIYNRKTPIKWIISHLIRYPYFFFPIFLLGIINNWAYGNIQLKIGNAFNIITKSNWILDELVIVAVIIAVSAFIQGFSALLRNFSFEFIAQHLEKDAREEFYISLLGKSQTFHGKQKVGDIMARATNDVRHLNLMFNPGLMLIIDSSLGIVIPLIMIGFIHPYLLLVPVIFLIFLFITVKDYNNRLGPVSIKQREQFGIMNSTLQEAIEGIEVVKSNVKEKYELNKFTGDAGIFKDYFIKMGLIQAKYWPMLTFVVCQGLAFCYGLILWKYKILSLGEIISYLGLFNTFRYATFISIFSFNLVQLGLASAKRILDLINYDSELDENSAGVSKEIKGKVTFDKVDFSFNNKKILDNLSFSINKGETVAIVGQTGSGKTTLTRLINRIFDVNSGKILIDDIDIKNWNMESLRSQISTIEQDVFLFSSSIKDNISFGCTDADNDSIINASKEAQSHNFIRGFKEQYDTVIGERGVTLSGGQKQRLAIARAFLTNPKILILDDSTSAIDSETEDEIQRAMKKISSERTTFIITHRLSQIRWADKIIVLKKGSIVDCGTHDELINRCTSYKKIFAN